VCGVVSKKRWYACWAHVPKSVGSIPTANRFDFCIVFVYVFFDVYLKVSYGKSVGSIPTANKFEFCIFYMLFAQIYFYLRMCKSVRVGSNITAGRIRP
jgi:hypothetical protein